MGMDWSLREGYAWAEDKEHCEEYGRMLSADPTKVSARAKKCGLPQLGTLGPAPPGAIKAFQPLVEYLDFSVGGLLSRISQSGTTFPRNGPHSDF